MRLENLSPTRCRITYADPSTGQVTTREFFVPVWRDVSNHTHPVMRPGLVRERLSMDLPDQACPTVTERLSRGPKSGAWLLWTASETSPLATLIRREYRRMIRDSRRDPFR